MSVSNEDKPSRGHHLGTLRLRHELTHDVLLIPTPSSDPRDPLNWPQWYKFYVAGLSAWAIFLSTFCSAGPAVTLTNMTITFFGPPVDASFFNHIAKAAYFFTVAALLMGVSNIVWVPLMVKFGRRPVYVFAYTFYCGTNIWCAEAQTYSSMLAACAFLGCAAGAGEVLGPLTIADLFFVHERGTMMVIYTCTLAAGTSLGSLVSGVITINHSWRYIYWVTTALTGATALLMFFTLPETTYKRAPLPASALHEGNVVHSAAEAAIEAVLDDKEAHIDKVENTITPIATTSTARFVAPHPTIWEIVTTPPWVSYTSESMLILALRPLVLILLPSALWASLVMAVSIGFLVAMSSNVATAFTTTYGFSTWQIGVSMISGTIGAAIAIFFGGRLSDMVADRFTRRNGGLREPEMRLPAMAISLISGPLSLILYGVGVGHNLHWICPVIAFGLINFTIVQAANIAIVYMIDCYRPIAGEVTTTQYTFKSLFGFLLSFYTNTWISKSGYTAAFGEMAAISGAVFLSTAIFFFYGKALRVNSWNWPVMKIFLHWKGDREVGE
ncbi:hypothetical protein Sste5346_010374 [Sporothrix stenoceras]|uniref:Major facilitator superfamily (MFS) profile domain-containing protein n=1 Tax=Sporothrix stenoceras TaxID=5173 RepID=A0ABR3YID2_9PEZI